MGTEVKIIKEPEKTCRLEQGDYCCIYLTLGAQGFICEKNSGSGVEKILTKRLHSGTTNAKGSGGWEGCIWA